MIKVFSLRVGSTKVPFGEFYGGLDGWRGARAVYRFATDKKHFIIVPIHAYLIDHPEEGLILVDAGINWPQTHDHGAYYQGVAHYLDDEDEYQLTRGRQLPAALASLGYRVEDVRFLPMVYQPSLEAARKITTVDYGSGAVRNFDASHDSPPTARSSC